MQHLGRTPYKERRGPLIVAAPASAVHTRVTEAPLRVTGYPIQPADKQNPLPLHHPCWDLLSQEKSLFENLLDHLISLRKTSPRVGGRGGRRDLKEGKIIQVSLKVDFDII